MAGVARQVAAFEVLQEPSMAAEDFSFYAGTHTRFELLRCPF